MTSNKNQSRQQIRQLGRARRNELSFHHQQQASQQLTVQLQDHHRLGHAKNIALYLANDGELDPMPLIKELWRQGKHVYLPVVHPFSPGNLLFLRYRSDSVMVTNKYGISEPRLNVTIVCPVAELDVIFTPLVAFDEGGNRMGMGGGYYDRTLCVRQNLNRPYPIGLAHDCQLVDQLPIEAWDIPLPEIITPSRIYRHLSGL